MDFFLAEDCWTLEGALDAIIEDDNIANLSFRPEDWRIVDAKILGWISMDFLLAEQLSSAYQNFDSRTYLTFIC